LVRIFFIACSRT